MPVARQLYIHVPFCRKKCGYCAFYSESRPDAVAPYLEKLVGELALDPFRYETIYLGGGTPSLLGMADLERLFAVLADKGEPGAEISMEANPETLTLEKMTLIRAHVNRLSLGVQSFDAAKRAMLGRDCSDAAIDRAVGWARELAFPHWNCDLMYAVPGETEALWREDLRRAAATGADHISCYSLTPEEGTRLAGTRIDEDASADGWAIAGEVLAEHGFARYEISNYARPGGECRHNCRVWGGSRLTGYGPAAASYDGEKRYRQVADVRQWLAGAAPELDELPPAERRREIAVVKLRMASGWTRAEYLSLPGATPEEWAELTSRLSRCPYPGLTEADESRARLTEAGLLYWDEIAEELL